MQAQELSVSLGFRVLCPFYPFVHVPHEQNGSLQACGDVCELCELQTKREHWMTLWEMTCFVQAHACQESRGEKREPWALLKYMMMIPPPVGTVAPLQ